MGFSEAHIAQGNDLYMKVTKGYIYRGNSRKAIIFACMYTVYKLSGNPQSYEKMMNSFKLTTKSALKGLRQVNSNIPKDYLIQIKYEKPINIVDQIMDLFHASETQKEDVRNYYSQIKNKSSKLNRSRPQSVACGLIYYWIKKEGKSITLKEFADKTHLSESTINAIAKEVGDILAPSLAPSLASSLTRSRSHSLTLSIIRKRNTLRN